MNTNNESNTTQETKLDGSFVPFSYAKIWYVEKGQNDNCPLGGWGINERDYITSVASEYQSGCNAFHLDTATEIDFAGRKTNILVNDEINLVIFNSRQFWVSKTNKHEVHGPSSSIDKGKCDLNTEFMGYLMYRKNDQWERAFTVRVSAKKFQAKYLWNAYEQFRYNIDDARNFVYPNLTPAFFICTLRPSRITEIPFNDHTGSQRRCNPISYWIGGEDAASLDASEDHASILKSMLISENLQQRMQRDYEGTKAWRSNFGQQPRWRI